ncbi:PQQ-like beta-propeller repeat protein [Couchioplanes caeruleus]|uniref:PQQ-like beta-propeller repeat protein n=1 Tax=Couchioplanes caeruleus TaxID=56438 RepID=UPI0020C0E5A4|nr:PQQ-like beta-propeller repeat protein [Couchioplanes caeruleus]UQU66397.1 PQQ-like beta-propeller repeat protein [Couchioplanes caeruleus]
MGDVVIDLGELHDEQPLQPAPARRPFPFRAALAVAAVALLVLVSGSAPRLPPVTPTVVPARLGDAMFVENDRLYLVSAPEVGWVTAAQDRVVSTYALPGGTLLSRTTAAVTGGVLSVTSAGDAILVSYQVDTLGAEATVAVEAGTDHARWRAPARLLSVSRADNVALLRENSPESGHLDWYGVDLTTGRNRWVLRQPILGYTTEAGYDDGFPGRLVTATVAGHLEVRDTVTGRVTATLDVPAPPTWSRRGITVWPAGDLVLVGGLGDVTAYDLRDLRERWRNDLDLSGRWVQPDCAGAICLFGYRGGVQVVDTLTGAFRWSSDRWTWAEPTGRYLLVTGNEGLEARYPLAVVDPVTGELHGDFGNWRSVGEVRPDGTVIGLRQRIGDDVVWYALLDPRTLAVRVLGKAAGVSGDCQGAGDVLVCRGLDASVAIWPLTDPVTDR